MERFISRFVCLKNNGFSYRRMTFSVSSHSRLVILSRKGEEPLFLEWLLRGIYAALLRFIAYKAYVVAEVFVNAREF